MVYYLIANSKKTKKRAQGKKVNKVISLLILQYHIGRNQIVKISDN